MFTSGRPCLGRRLSVVLDTAAAGPEDPLLFLYPRWAASALQQRRSIVSWTPRTLPRNKSRAPPRSFRSSNSPALPLPSLSRQSVQWSSSNASSRDLENPASGQFSRANAKTAGGRNRVEHGRPIQEPKSSPRTPHGRVGNGNQKPTTRRTPGTTNMSDKEKRRRRIEGSTKALTQRKSPQSTPEFTPASDLRKKLSVKDRRKLRYEGHLKNIGNQGFTPVLSDTWDDMMILLEAVENNTRTEAVRSTKSRELLVPEATLALLAGVLQSSLRDNIWFVHWHHGCKVQVLNAAEAVGGDRKVILTGSDHTMDLVEAQIRRTQALQEKGDPLVDMENPPVTIVSSLQSGGPKMRGYWDFAMQTKLHKVLSLKEVRLPHSSLRTVREFTEYVEDLTNASLATRRPGRISVTRNPKTDGDEITRRLTRLFQDESLRPFLSTAATNRALEFLCDHNQVKGARIVFSHANHVATTDSYNIFLRFAARHRDVRHFRRFLLLMSQGKIRPNAKTWLALLEALITPSEKAAVVTRMVQNGHMTNFAVIRSALALTIQDSLYVHLERGQSVESFIALMKQTHGADWFTPSLLGQMFSVTARLKNFAATDELLEICAREALDVDCTAFVQVLPMCRSTPRDALRYLFMFSKFRSFRMLPQAWERLFLIAFKNRYYNMCRVLWRYACMNQSVSLKMRQTVLTSMLSTIPEDSPADTNHFRVYAGKIITGVGQPLEENHVKEFILNNIPSEFHDNPITYLLAARTQSKKKNRNLRYLMSRDLVYSDIFNGPIRYKPINSLYIMLEAALIIEEEFRAAPRPFNWLMQNAIHVPVERLVKA
ncbi:hypothetical protein N7488_001329 [Penicillium malachiteum]|nr:hypothetical protein N7488_001329 [Penicillium malachiteum]